MKNWTLAAVVAALAACGARADTDSGPSPSVTMVGDTTVLELPVGRSADNGQIEIRFDAVTEDSRCPTDVQCVWAGNAGVRLTLAAGDEQEVVIVNSTLDPRQASFMGHVIALRDLSPMPISASPTDQSSYVARIGIVGAQ